MRTAEFDAFGPWIAQVRTNDEVPRLYRDFRLDLDTYRLVLKVPRNISRRDASPEMNLYDHLLAVGTQRLTILSRRGDRYIESAIAYDRIAAITDDVNLLDGRLTVHSVSDGDRTLRYNGSSHGMVDGLVALLRELSQRVRGTLPTTSTAGEPPVGRPVPGLRELGERDVALVTSCRELLRREPQVRLLAAHGRSVLVPRGSAVTRGLHRARPMTLQGAVVCVDERELQVLCRRDFLVRGNRPVDSIARVVVPLARIDAVTVREHARYRAVSVVTVRAGATSIELPVPTGSAAQDALVGVVAGARR